jgi:hypothetical protein
MSTDDQVHACEVLQELGTNVCLGSTRDQLEAVTALDLRFDDTERSYSVELGNGRRVKYFLDTQEEVAWVEIIDFYIDEDRWRGVTAHADSLINSLPGETTRFSQDLVVVEAIGSAKLVDSYRITILRPRAGNPGLVRLWQRIYIESADDPGRFAPI